ncbi:MAG: hypothetical protein AB7O52_06725 [Planctomycetota bacterium]
MAHSLAQRRRCPTRFSLLLNTLGIFLAECFALSPPIASAHDVVLQPPMSGGLVRVFVPLDGRAPDTLLFARNRSLAGESGPWTRVLQTHLGWECTLPGGGGDLVELRRMDAAGVEWVELAGVVPLAADVLPPECAANAWAVDAGDTQSTLHLRPSKVLDASYPIQIDVLDENGHPLGHGELPSNATVSPSLRWTVPVATGSRLIVRLTDDFGNRSHMHWIIGSGRSPASGDRFPPGYVPPNSQARAERTGNAAVVRGVGLLAGDFQTSFNLLQLRGDRLDVAVTLHYRSHLAYPGPLGNGWDWVLDSRITSRNGNPCWLPGNARIEEDLTIGASAPGLFVRCDVDPVSQAFELTHLDGTRNVFSADTGLLSQIERNGHSVRVLRNSYGQVVALIDDKQRRTGFDWYVDGRLAAVTDYAARRTTLDYDRAGNLVSVSRNDGSQSLWQYDPGTSRLTEYREASSANATPIVLLQNAYDANGRVVDQRDPYCLATSSGYGFSELDPPAVPIPQGAAHVVRVVQPDGSTVDYGLGATPNAALVVARQHHDPGHRMAPSYPGQSDPAWVDVCYQYDPLNLLVAARWYRHADLPAGATLDLEQWDYLSSATSSPDSRMRSRLHSHVRDDGTGQLVTLETRDHTPLDPWPVTITRAGTQQKSFTWTSDGQLLESTQPGIATSTEAYSIDERHAYDASGRVTASWNANRLHDPSQIALGSPAPSWRYVYFERGYFAGWLARREQLDRNGEVVTATHYEYDVHGRVTKEVDPQGTPVVRRYDDRDRLVEETRLVRFTHPSAPQVPLPVSTFWTFGSGHEVNTYETRRDALGALLDSRPILVRQLLEDRSGPAFTQTERTAVGLSGTEVEYSQHVTTFDGNGRKETLARSRNASSPPTVYGRFTYDSAGRLLRRAELPEAPTGSELSHLYGYDHAGREIEYFAPGWSEPRRRFYDRLGRLAEEVGPRTCLGFTRAPDGTALDWLFGYTVTQMDYSPTDPGDRPIAIRRASVSGTQPDWTDPMARQPLRSSFLGYDAAGRLVSTSILQPSGELAETTLDLYPSGATRRRWLPADTNGVRDSVLVILDDLDRPEAIIDGVGNATSLIRAPSGRVMSMTQLLVVEDPSGAANIETRVTHYTHDLQGNVVETRYPTDPATGAATVEHRSYDSSGQLARTESSRAGNAPFIETVVRDLAGRPVAVTQARQHDTQRVFRYSYDHRGFLVAETSGDSLTTTYGYDGIGRPTKITSPGNRVRLIDHALLPAETGASHWTTVRDTSPEGKIVTRTLNELGQTLLEQAEWGTLPQYAGPRRVEYLYAEGGACGCPARAEPVEIRTRQDRSDLLPADTIVQRDYDPLGRMTAETILLRDSGAWTRSVVRFAHDANDRTIRVEYPSGATLHREARVDGLTRSLWWQRSRHEDEVLIEHLSYFGDQPRVVQTYGELDDDTPVLRSEYTYEATRRVSGATHTGINGTIASEFVAGFDPGGNALQRVRTIGGVVEVDSFSYSGRGDLSTELWGGMPQRRHVRTYDAAGRLVRHQTSQPPRDTVHRYDASGFLVETLGTENLHDERVLACEIPPPFPAQCATYQRTVLGRSFVVDADGNTTQQSYRQVFDTDCNGAHLFLPRFEHDVTHDYRYDAWGRLLTDRRSGSVTRVDLECPDVGPIGQSVEPLGVRTESRVYDGLGRLVCLENAGTFDLALDTDVLPATDQRHCFSYEGDRIVAARDMLGSRVEEYYPRAADARPRKGRELDPATGLDQLFTVGLDPNGFPTASNLGGPVDPTLGEGDTFAISFFNPIGVLVFNEGQQQPVAAPPAPPTPATATLEEKMQLWDDDWFGDDLLAKFAWETQWVCDGSGLRSTADPIARAIPLDDISVMTDFHRPKPVSDFFELTHSGSGSREEPSQAGGVGGAIAAGVVGVGAGAAAGSAFGGLGALPGAVVGGLVAAFGGALTGSEASSKNQVATHRTLWKISCEKGSDHYRIVFNVLNGPFSGSAGDLYWKAE